MTLFIKLGYSQIDYSIYISKSSVNKKSKVKTAEGQEEIIYLGSIINKKGQSLYDIITVFNKNNAIKSVRGHSNILIFDSNRKIIKTYELGLPSELPFKLCNNKLYFHYLDKKTNAKKVFTFDFDEKLPKLICVAPEDCY